MFEVRKPEQKPIAIIRAASSGELTEYERRKLETIEENAQENVIEAITLNNKKLPVDVITKEVNIEVGDLAFKHKVSPEDVSTDEVFFIKCDI